MSSVEYRLVIDPAISHSPLVPSPPALFPCIDDVVLLGSPATLSLVSSVCWLALFVLVPGSFHY